VLPEVKSEESTQESLAVHDSPKVSVVIPIYNEETLVHRLHGELLASLVPLGLSFEIIYVNDGSTDRSLELLVQCHSKDARVVVVELSRNWGHQAAVTAGLSLARGQAVLLMDGDLQDPPNVIPDLVAAWDRGAQVVIAQRRSRTERGLRSVLFPLFYRCLAFVSDFPIPTNAGVFCLLDRIVVDCINRLSETNRYLPGLRAWVGFKTDVVLYHRPDRPDNEPKQTFSRLVRYACDAIFSFSYKPLRLSLFAGFIVAIFAMIYGIILLTCRILGIGLFGVPVVNGYTSTIVSILFLGGVQLVSVGILGEYIGRIYDEVKHRPLFIVHKIHNRSNK